MSAADLYLVTYASGHTVLASGPDTRERAEFSVSRGFATRVDLEGGSFSLTDLQDGRTRLHEAVMEEPPSALKFRERISDDGLVWEDTGTVSASQAARMCARTVNRGGRLVYLASGAMTVMQGRRQCLRYEPVDG